MFRSRCRIAWLVLLLPLISSAQSTVPGPIAVDRLVVRFQANTLSIAQKVALKKRLPPPDVLPQGPAISGFWYELRSASGAVRYRRIMQNPLILSFEGPDLATQSPAPVRTEAIATERVFSVLVPQAQQGDVLVFFGTPLVPGAQGQPAQQLAQLVVP